MLHLQYIFIISHRKYKLLRIYITFLTYPLWMHKKALQNATFAFCSAFFSLYFRMLIHHLPKGFRYFDRSVKGIGHLDAVFGQPVREDKGRVLLHLRGHHGQAPDRQFLDLPHRPV